MTAPYCRLKTKGGGGDANASAGNPGGSTGSAGSGGGSGPSSFLRWPRRDYLNA